MNDTGYHVRGSSWPPATGGPPLSMEDIYSAGDAMREAHAGNIGEDWADSMYGAALALAKAFLGTPEETQ